MCIGYHVKIRLITYYFMAMQSMHFDITNIPYMSDRGHLIAVARFLERNLGVVILIKCCVEHIIRNIIHRFNVNKERLHNLRMAVNMLQGDPTFESFQHKSSGIIKLDDDNGPIILLYLLKTHLYHWTIFANRNDITASSWNNHYEEMIKELYLKTNTLTKEQINNLNSTNFYYGNLNKGKKF